MSKDGRKAGVARSSPANYVFAHSLTRAHLHKLRQLEVLHDLPGGVHVDMHLLRVRAYRVRVWVKVRVRVRVRFRIRVRVGVNMHPHDVGERVVVQQEGGGLRRAQEEWGLG